MLERRYVKKSSVSDPESVMDKGGAKRGLGGGIAEMFPK